MCRYLIHAAGPAGACQRVAGPRDALGAASPEPPSRGVPAPPVSAEGPDGLSGVRSPVLVSPGACSSQISREQSPVPGFQGCGLPQPRVVLSRLPGTGCFRCVCGLSAVGGRRKPPAHPGAGALVGRLPTTVE